MGMAWPLSDLEQQHCNKMGEIEIEKCWLRQAWLNHFNGQRPSMGLSRGPQDPRLACLGIEE